MRKQDHGVRTIGKKSVGVSVVQVLGRGERLHGAVPISVVLSALDLPQVGRLVQRSRGLVLAMAARGQRRELVKVQRARHHERLAGQRVRQDALLARVQDIGAVLGADAAGGAAALGGDGVEDGGDAGPGLRGRRLEVLGQLLRGAVGGRPRSVLGQRAAVGQRRALLLAVGARAVALQLRALHLGLQARVEVAADFARRLAVHVRVQQIAVVRDHARDLGAVERRGLERAAHEEVVIAAGAQVVDLGGIPFHIGGLASGQSLEGRLGQVGLLDGETNAIKVKRVVCCGKSR